jgi:hypothetical protein
LEAGDVGHPGIGHDHVFLPEFFGRSDPFVEVCEQIGDDGYDRLGMVYEARGDNKQAAQYYRQALEFIRQHPDQYDDSGLEAVFVRLIAKLDPPAP